MQATSSTEISDDFQWTTWHHEPQDKILLTIMITLKLLYQNISQTLFNITISVKVTVLLETYSHFAKQYIPAKLIPSLQWQYCDDDDDYCYYYYTAIGCSPSGSRSYTDTYKETGLYTKGTIAKQSTHNKVHRMQIQTYTVTLGHVNLWKHDSLCNA
jgi:hypothetical protein